MSIAIYAGLRPDWISLAGAALLSALISVAAVGLPSQVSFVAVLSPSARPWARLWKLSSC